MRKINLAIIFAIILVTGFLSGCTNTGTTTEEEVSSDITLESEVVRLVHAKLIPKKDEDILVSMDVEYLFKNIAGRVVSVQVTAEYYDEQDNLLYTSEPRLITNLPIDYTETNISPTNVISYSGGDADKVDHIKIVADEYFGT